MERIRTKGLAVSRPKVGGSWGLEIFLYWQNLAGCLSDIF
jgi:hypothetical protein